MADNYSVISRRQTQELTQAGGLIDVMETTIQCNPSGTVRSFRIPLTEDNPGSVAAMAEQIAADENAVFTA